MQPDGSEGINQLGSLCGEGGACSEALILKTEGFRGMFPWATVEGQVKPGVGTGDEHQPGPVSIQDVNCLLPPNCGNRKLSSFFQG